jgi:hypothetical protein
MAYMTELHFSDFHALFLLILFILTFFTNRKNIQTVDYHLSTGAGAAC